VRGVLTAASKIPGDLFALGALGSGVQVPQIEDPAKLPDRLVVFPWGEHKTAKGMFRVGEVTLSSLPANQKLTNFDRVVLDFDHNTVPGSASYKGEPALIAATARVACHAGEGIVYEDIQWTEEGKRFIGGGHYRDLSPTVKRDASGNVIWLHSAAACRVGVVPDLILFSASTEEPNNPNPKNNPAMDIEKLKAIVCALLGLDPEKATDEEIEAAAKKASEKEAKEAAAATGSGENKSKGTEELSDKVDKLSATVNAFISASQKGERERLLERATREGKVVPKAISALPVETLSALIDELPVTVPVEKRTVAGVDALSASTVSLNNAQDEVNRALGISKDTFEKHNK